MILAMPLSPDTVRIMKRNEAKESFKQHSERIDLRLLDSGGSKEVWISTSGMSDAVISLVIEEYSKVGWHVSPVSGRDGNCLVFSEKK